MVLMVPLLIMATSLVSKINTRVALVKGWVNSFLAFMGQLYIGFYMICASDGEVPNVEPKSKLSCERLPKRVLFRYPSTKEQNSHASYHMERISEGHLS